jgi:hypothetical protein
VGHQNGGKAKPSLKLPRLRLHGLAKLAIERAERFVKQ